MTDADTGASVRRVVIAGGGIAGLSAAYRLAQIAPEVETVLVEPEHRLGGKLLTDRVDGFTIEAGPDSFLSSKPAGLALCRELGLDDQLQGVQEESRRTFVLRGGSLYRLPEGLSGLVPSRLGPMFRSPLLSPTGKLRVALERLIPARRDEDDETLGSFIRRRLGAEVFDRLVEPLMAGIYGGNGDDLSLAATFPQLRRLEREHGSLLRGLSMTSRPATPNRSPFVTPRGGMASIAEAIRARLGPVRVISGRSVSRVTVERTEYAVHLDPGEVLRADAVILATPAYVSAGIVESLDESIARILRSIPYASTATVSLAYPMEVTGGPLPGHGYIVPRREGRAALASTWTSSKFAHRAPEGYVLLRVFLGRAGQEDIVIRPDDELVAMARREIEHLVPSGAQPAVARVYRWPRSMPQYTLGHLDRVTALERRLEQHLGLLVAGSAYRGVGIPDCIESGQGAAQAAVSALSRPDNLR